jgi:cytochrome c
MKIMQTAAAISCVIALGLGPATAHQQGNKLHLADAPPDQQVEAIDYCKGVYRVVTKQGEPVEYPEFDLRFKTDASEDGPKPGNPTLINAGMRGDRGFVVFSNPSEMTTWIKTAC